MNVRIFMPLAVFVAGFGLGYGLTWLLVGPDSASALSSAPSVSPTLVATGPTELDGSGATPSVEARAPEAAEEAEDEALEVDDEEVDDEDVDDEEVDDEEVDDEEVDEPAADDEEVDEPAVDDADPEAAESDDATPDDTAPDTTAEDAADPEPSAPRWWDACKGVTCQVDWGGIEGGMSIREGSVTHGETVSWEPTYAAARRLLIVPTQGRTQPVTLLAVAMGIDGIPSVAHLRLSSDGQDVTGVLKLEVNGKRISLRPTTRP